MTVKLSYVNNKNVHGEYYVEPVSVIYKWYNWYLLCFYIKSDEYRIFKLQRIEDISVTAEKISKEHNAENALKTWEEQPDKRKYIQVEILCKSSVKNRCLEYIKGSIKEELTNGDVIMAFTVAEDEFFWYGALLALGQDVKILKPDHLKDKVSSTYKEILSLYDNM